MHPSAASEEERDLAPSTSAPPRPPSQQQREDPPPSLLARARSAAWRAWLAVDCAVAWLTGLDQSRYQWAIERYHQQQADLALRAHVLDGELSSTAPHVAPPSNLMVADAENPRARC